VGKSERARLRAGRGSRACSRKPHRAHLELQGADDVRLLVHFSAEGIGKSEVMTTRDWIILASFALPWVVLTIRANYFVDQLMKR
jgi:hypothetical protein